MSSGLNVEAARKLGETTVQLKELTAKNDRLKKTMQEQKKREQRIQVEMCKMENTRQEHAHDEQKLLHAISEVQKRSAAYDEDVRLLEETCRNLQQRKNVVELSRAQVKDEIERLRVDIRVQTAAREQEAVREQRTRQELKSVRDTKTQAVKKKVTVESQLKRAKVTSNQFQSRSDYVQAVLS